MMSGYHRCSRCRSCSNSALSLLLMLGKSNWNGQARLGNSGNRTLKKVVSRTDDAQAIHLGPVTHGQRNTEKFVTPLFFDG